MPQQKQNAIAKFAKNEMQFSVQNKSKTLKLNAIKKYVKSAMLSFAHNKSHIALPSNRKLLPAAATGIYAKANSSRVKPIQRIKLFLNVAKIVRHKSALHKHK